jgi:hypothetical protein
MFVILVMLIELHAVDGSLIEVNPQTIASLRGRSPNDGHFAKGVNCLINTTDGLHLSVRETCSQILEKIK